MEKIELRTTREVRNMVRRGLAAARKSRRLPKLSQNTYLCELLNKQLDAEMASIKEHV